uniref:FTH domain-containing protein n=1 Tax=Heterorhabditis bacteriophora TaxID=37862 RepID=A0A1I7XKV6_HETBA
MVFVNVTHCNVDIEASQNSDITVLTRERDESQLVDSFFPRSSTRTSFNSGDIRELKLVSKQLKRLIERHWRPAFFILPLKIQLKILIEINITLDFYDRLRDLLLENRITCNMLSFSSCDFNDEEIMTIVDRLLGATEANQLMISEHRNINIRFEKEFFWMPSIRKLKELGLRIECDFSDDDLSATDYRVLYLRRCRISEYALRRFLEQMASENANPEVAGDSRLAPSEMTSKDYYFDSYAHFGIHEVKLSVTLISLESGLTNISCYNFMVYISYSFIYS